LLALLDQYFELQFKGIATGDESWVYYVIGSDSRFARQPEAMIPRPRPGISIQRVVIAVIFIVRQSIPLDALPKVLKCNKEYCVQNILPSLLNEKKRFSRQKLRLILLCT
jgi:hypothetical protein